MSLMLREGFEALCSVLTGDVLLRSFPWEGRELRHRWSCLRSSESGAHGDLIQGLVVDLCSS